MEIARGEDRTSQNHRRDTIRTAERRGPRRPRLSLRHAVAPDALLRALAPKLRPGGRACVSIPHVRFWSEFVAPLLDGSWDYAPHGVLDRTHLRWFTERGFYAMAAAAGFEADGPALRVHFGPEHGAPEAVVAAVAASLGAAAAASLAAESDVRQLLIPLRRAGDARARGDEL